MDFLNKLKPPIDSAKLPMKRIAWISYLLVGASSIFFLRGIIFGGQASGHSLFRVWAIVHTLIAGVIGIYALDSIGRNQASNLVKLTGYLYTLTGLILAIETIETNTASVFTGAGGALLSSLVGWFFGGLIEREEAPLLSGENISLALDPEMTAQLNAELKATSELLSISREKLEHAEQEISQQRALLQQTNQLLEEVKSFISDDPERRQLEEAHRDQVLQQLIKVDGKLG